MYRRTIQSFLFLWYGWLEVFFIDSFEKFILALELIFCNVLYF